MNSDPEHKIGRPRQLYTGQAKRDFVPIDQRKYSFFNALN
jgi:citrate synthase